MSPSLPASFKALPLVMSGRRLAKMLIDHDAGPLADLPNPMLDVAKVHGGHLAPCPRVRVPYLGQKQNESTSSLFTTAMNLLSICTLAILLLPASAIPGSLSARQASLDDDRTQIENAFKRRVESFNARDLRQQLALFAPDADYYSSTGKLSVTGREDIGLLFLAAWNGPMAETAITETIRRISFLSDANAVAIVEFEVAFDAPEDSTISYRQLRGVRVLEQHEGKWLIRMSCQTPYDEDATLTPEHFAEVKERFREEYNRQMQEREEPSDR